VRGAHLGIRPARAAPKIVHIGTRKGVTLYILRDRNMLQQALVYDIACTEFPGGPQLPEALNAGAIDFGTTGGSAAGACASIADTNTRPAANACN
jgi:ABC-type nitrate/sulfonate/bicarbonate transport system substrate-binding protein